MAGLEALTLDLSLTFQRLHVSYGVIPAYVEAKQTVLFLSFTVVIEVKKTFDFIKCLSAHLVSNLWIEASRITSEYSSLAFEESTQFDSTNFSDDTKRKLGRVGSYILEPAEMEELSNIISYMGNFYGSFQACRETPTGTQECMYLEPELTDLMDQSRDPEERLWAWKTWHDGIGQEFRDRYIRYVELKNKMARLNGYTDYGDRWRQKYDTTTLEADVDVIYEELKPLYLQLHAYIRRRLYETYGDVVDLTGPLPGHLLGDMWGRFWINLETLATPYPNRTSVDPTPEMIAQGYTPRKMFDIAEEFYTSMGLRPLPPKFFNLSMIEKPDDRDVVCHATAWDFYDGQDFRIKMCTRVAFEDFLTIHHELGHTQYQMQYSHLPVFYKDGANDGFHEAVGELMAMCVATPKHLYEIGLLGVLEDDPEVDINFLLQQALNTVSTLPFHLVQDSWRWKAFRGDFPVERWNDEYWKLKEEIVGVKAPTTRDSMKDLDITAIFHVNQDYDMIRYFMRTVIQYQFAEALCNASGHEGPLYKCDFYRSKEAGNLLANMLSMGSSQPWQDAMEAITGQRDIKVDAIKNYFEPLRVWLEAKNIENNELIGWTTSH
ncbi:hypothetical protein QYM36_014833 [Artemia franciscana]|uniref:Angiotensin-converting enzyme n=1 Tax=Artemia franciscana TaxID=6661 RepID=A0AA88HJQ5_ARTSF|nr:hypothetical protein QYM36_014833 [Artemia franciscana]